MRSDRLAGLSIVLALSACGGPTATYVTGTDTDTGTSGSSSGSSSGPTSGTTSTSSSSSSSSSSEGTQGDTDGEEPIAYARGIRLDWLTANQGVEVEIVRDGAAVSADEYPIRMIRSRRTLLRGYWSLHAGFEARELVGRLTVEYPDGTTTEQDFTQMVEGTSNESPSASFQWLLEPDEVVPGMRLRARVLEPNPETAPGEVSDPPPVAPLEGPTELTLVDQAMQLEVVLVPMLHQFDGCEQAPEVTDEDATAMQQLLEENNPVQEALVTVREPLPFTDSISAGPGFSPINAELAQAKIDDGAAAQVYYYGLILFCDGYPAGLGGQAIAIPGAPETIDDVPNASQGRIPSGRWNGSGAAAAETFVHEVGHTQGRRHVTCSGGEAGPENDYPHLGGRIGAWGFGIYDFSLRGPTVGRDYMTYCSNAWVSDYGWEQTFDVISLLTEYASLLDAPPHGSAGGSAVLAGLIDGDYQSWWIEPGPTPTPTPGDVLRLQSAGVPVDVPAQVQPIPHSDSGSNVRAALPIDVDDLSAATLERGGSSISVDITAIAARAPSAPERPVS